MSPLMVVCTILMFVGTCAPINLTVYCLYEWKLQELYVSSSAFAKLYVAVSLFDRGLTGKSLQDMS